ncbi:diguanylate cyclase DgcA [Spirochaetia bacterium 38H-sp]|uniref:diguanylate cyclase n=1 Tax=Rarispira pelagica TaxID=3141764 RepID=A0ABU9U961_9SPIR
MDESNIEEQEKKKYEKQIYDLKQLIEVSKSLNTNLDLDDLIDSILYVTMGQLRVEKAGIFVRRGMGNYDFILHRNCFGFEVEKHNIEFRISGKSPLIRLLEQSHNVLSLDELQENMDDYDIPEVIKVLNPHMIVPLLSKKVVYGILILGEKIDGKSFSIYEKNYLIDLANIASVALHNAFLYEMAVTDFLTKLKLRNYFESVLIDNIFLANRDKVPLSLIMGDLDHFKLLNDTYGHLAGDLVLQDSARIIMEHIRKTDVAARYGGEEFAILLPNTSLESAYYIANRIRENIENNVIVHNNTEMRITISLGVAQYDPIKDESKEAFIERADKALYMAKEKGRNRVCI